MEQGCKPTNPAPEWRLNPVIMNEVCDSEIRVGKEGESGVKVELQTPAGEQTLAFRSQDGLQQLQIANGLTPAYILVIKLRSSLHTKRISQLIIC